MHGTGPRALSLLCMVVLAVTGCDRSPARGALPEWRVMHFAPPPENAGLNDVSAVDARTIFAVGSTGYPGRPFAGRWNGTRWEEITSGLPSTTGMELTLVGAVSALDAWALGYEFPKRGGPDGSLHLYHWNGRSWRPDAMTIPSGDRPRKGMLTATPDGHVWLVHRGTMRHWDGRSWQTEQPPPGCGCTYVRQIVARNGDDAWAVAPVTRADQAWESALLHWNGQAWRRVRTAPGVSLYGLAVTSSSGVWAAGDACVKTGPMIRAQLMCELQEDVVLREAPGGWRRERLPETAGETMITANSHGRAWIYSPGNPVGRFAYHDGDRWRSIPNPHNPRAVCAHVTSMTSVPGTSSFLAVGHATSKTAGPCIAITGSLSPDEPAEQRPT
jgi:hypothetical protein